MKILVKCCSCLAAIIASLAAVPAHASTVLVILLVCELDDVDGPTRPMVQTSGGFDRLCADIFDLPICLATSEIHPDMSCAEASSRLLTGGAHLVSVEGAEPASKPLLIIAEDIEGEALATGLPHKPRPNITYVNVHDTNHSVGLVGCNYFVADGPIATFVDDSEDPNASVLFDDLSMTCANALQAQLNKGRTETDGIVGPNTRPPFLAGPADDSGSGTTASGLPTGKRQHKPVSVFHVESN